MGIKLGCPKCGKDFDVHPALAGQPLDCSDCGNTFIVPSSAPAVESNDRDPIRKKVPQVPCPKCGTQYIVEGAPSKIEIECESCGHRFTKSKRKKRKVTSALPIGQIAGNSPKDVPVQPKPQSGSFFRVAVVIGGLGVLLFIMVGLLIITTKSAPGGDDKKQGENVTAKEIETFGNDKKQGENVTAKEIETFGNELQGKHVQMTAKFVEVSDTWVRLKLKDNSFVGLYFKDSNGDLFQFAFASKEKYGRTLLQMKKGADMRLTGTVRSIGGTYVFLVDEIQR
jgi:ribosomal protein L37AE/L43A